MRKLRLEELQINRMKIIGDHDGEEQRLIGILNQLSEDERERLRKYNEMM